MNHNGQQSRFLDLQVNGYAGVDFNSETLDAESLHRACSAMQRDGVSGAFATIITEDLPIMTRQLQRLTDLRDADPLVQNLIHGFHVEGPFISGEAGYAGAHPIDAVQPATPDAAEQLLQAGGGLVKLVTLAPECDPEFAVTQMLSEKGIVVAAGHTNATLDQLAEAVDAGLRLFSHLGNGCPMSLPRHDNIVQRALWVARHKPLSISFIADGIHVAFPALGNYLHSLAPDRCIIVSDATAAAGLGPGRYRLGRNLIDISADGVPSAPGGSHLLGSATSLKQMAENLRTHLGLSADEITALTQTNPRRLLNLDSVPDASPGAASVGQ